MNIGRYFFFILAGTGYTYALPSLPSCHLQNLYDPSSPQLLASLKEKLEESTVWNLNALSPGLKKRLSQYHDAQIGMAARLLSLEGKTFQELDSELIQKGFKKDVVPLKFGKGRYIRKDGTITKNKNDSLIVSHHIYVHEDGSQVRIKPEGIPLKNALPRHFPHASKSILFISTHTLCEFNFQKKCKPIAHLSYQDEAFKLVLHYPVPKSPQIQHGISPALPPPDVNALMRLAHPHLKSNFDHCRK